VKILITGGSGFIGGYVYRHLKDSGFNVKNFDIIGNSKDSDFIQGSIIDFDDVKNAVFESDIIFHFAGFSNINKVKNTPLECVRLNILGTTNILEALRLKRDGKLIFASSVYVHNNNGHLYTSSKLAAERICENYSTLFNVTTSIIRLGTVYGEYSRHEDVISIFVKRMCNGENIHIHGDGEQKRNFIHGNDVARACERILISNVFGKKLIISSDEQTSINQLVSMLKKMDPSLQFMSNKELIRKDDYVGDIGNVKETYNLLKWEPSINLLQGVNRMKNYFAKSVVI